MNKKKLKLLPMLMLLLLGGWLSSCVDDQDPSSRIDGKEKLMSFSIRVPGSSTPKTYALSEGDENEVKSIAILLFDAAGDYAYQPIYVNKITTDPSDSRIKTFTANIPVGTYSMVMLANANNIVGNALATLTIGDTKQSVMDKLILTLPANTKWNSDPDSAGYMPIPMWGETGTIVVNSALAGAQAVSLTRMLSKIDVSLATAAQAKFKLKSVRLYNYNNKGFLAPSPADWNAVGNIATAPSVPASAVKPTPQGNAPHVYDGLAITTPDIASKGEIYTLESNVINAANLKDKTCLVIGGSFNGGVETFYRVDFARTTAGVSTYLNLLRNHQYNVVISDVSAPGLTTAIDAFNSLPVNIKANVIAWSDGHFTDFAVNDQYIIGVSQGKFDFTREQRTATINNLDNDLSIFTDYASGWKILKIADGAGTPVTWLTTSALAGASTTPAGDNIKLYMTENTTGAKRTAYIHVTADADRLVYKVEVNQDIVNQIAISIRNATNQPITELVFPSTVGVQPVAQQFKLNWSPAANDLFFTSTSASNAFAFGAGSDVIPSAGGSLSDPLGTTTYNIRPTAITAANLAGDPFYERSSVLIYTVADGAEVETKTLILKQLIYNLTADAKSNYMTLGGKSYSFFVKSNTQWRIKSVNETIKSGTTNLLAVKASDNLRAGTKGGPNITSGNVINFTTATTGNGTTEVAVVFESVHTPKQFADVTVVFSLITEYYPAMHKGWAGSNIYWNGTQLTFDPVGVTTHENYQGLFFRWGSLWGIAPNGNYSAATTLYSPNKTSGTSTSFGLGTFNSIPKPRNPPLTSNPPAGKGTYNRAYLWEITDGATGVGDICKYMTDMGWAPGSPATQWRMPTGAEFGTTYSAWLTSVGTTTTSNIAGTGTVALGRRKTDSTPSPFFPAGGRMINDGDLSAWNNQAWYWSSSSNPDVNPPYSFAYSAVFYAPIASDNGIYPLYKSGDFYAYNVRCVVD